MPTLPFRFCHRRRITVAIAVLMASGFATEATAQTHPTGQELVEALRRGGHVLVCRHTATDHDASDRGSDRSSQRNLTAAGEADADRIGTAIRTLRIPIGEVRANPMYRNQETAQRAFGRMVVDSTLAGRGAADAVRKALRSPVAPGTNQVLVTRIGILMRVFDNKPRRIEEGDCVVARRGGDSGFDVLAILSPADWSRLAGL